MQLHSKVRWIVRGLDRGVAKGKGGESASPSHHYVFVIRKYGGMQNEGLESPVL